MAEPRLDEIRCRVDVACPACSAELVLTLAARQTRRERWAELEETALLEEAEREHQPPAKPVDNS
jgi:hypothetical protein